MKKTMLTCETLDRFEKEYKTEQYTETQIETIERAAYVANMNRNAHPEWTKDDIFADFLRVLGIDHIETEKAETAQEKTDRKNWEHCKRIAEELDEIAEGNIYRCPHCGEFIKWDDDQYNEDEARYTCPECGEEFDESDLEAVSMWDYFNDVYDIEYRVGSDKQYRSVCLMVACGGPNIYIDTAEKAVLLYWWTDRARYSLLSSTAEAIDEVFEEYFNC